MSDGKKDAVLYTFKEPARMVFGNILEAKAFKEDGKEKGEPRHDITLALDPDNKDLADIKALVIATLKAANPGKQFRTRRLTQEEVDNGGFIEVNVPWQDGTKMADEAKAKGKDQEFLRGKIAVKATSKFPPALSGIENGKVVEYDQSNPAVKSRLKSVFYRGAYVGPVVQLHDYPARDKKPGGVGLWLNALCFVKGGEKIGGAGAINAAETFKHYAGSVSTVNPGSNDLDDEIPF